MTPFQKFDQIIDDFFPAPHKCETCKHSHTAIPYPMLTCSFRGEYVKPKETCCRWEGK